MAREEKLIRDLTTGSVTKTLLRFALRFKPLVLLAALALLALAAMQVPKMGISFMPQVNSRQMSADLAFPPEMTDQQQKDQAKREGQKLFHGRRLLSESGHGDFLYYTMFQGFQKLSYL